MEFDVLTTGYGLVEGPTILPDGGVAFSDVLGGGIRRWSPDGSVTELVPKRRGVGGIAVHADGGIVCSGRTIIHVVDGETHPLCEVEVAGWNDLAVDPAGRIWAGAVRFAVFDGAAPVVPGELWCIDGIDDRPVVDGIHHANGVGFDPAGGRVYVSDSRRQVVVSADLDGGGRREFDFPLPDGMAVDADGFLWIASFTESRVVRVDPDGTPERSIDVGAPVTSVCLAPDGTLYVATASTRDHQASLLRTEVGIAGLPLPPATVRP